MVVSIRWFWYLKWLLLRFSQSCHKRMGVKMKDVIEVLEFNWIGVCEVQSLCNQCMRLVVGVLIRMWRHKMLADL